MKITMYIEINECAHELIAMSEPVLCRRKKEKKGKTTCNSPIVAKMAIESNRIALNFIFLGLFLLSVSNLLYFTRKMIDHKLTERTIGAMNNFYTELKRNTNQQI